jgi:hypothetical protein
VICAEKLHKWTLSNGSLLQQGFYRVSRGMPNYRDPGPGLSGSAELYFTERSSFHSHNLSNETIDKTKSSTGYPIKLVELPGSSTLNDQ